MDGWMYGWMSVRGLCMHEAMYIGVSSFNSPSQTPFVADAGDNNILKTLKRGSRPLEVCVYKIFICLFT